MDNISRFVLVKDGEVVDEVVTDTFKNAIGAFKERNETGTYQIAWINRYGKIEERNVRL